MCLNLSHHLPLLALFSIQIGIFPAIQPKYSSKFFKIKDLLGCPCFKTSNTFIEIQPVFMQSFVILAIIFIASTIMVHIRRVDVGAAPDYSPRLRLELEPTRGNKSEVWYENPNLNKLNINYFKYGTLQHLTKSRGYYNNTYLIFVPISFVGWNVIKTVYFWIFWLETEIMTKVYLYWPLCILSMNYWNISTIKCTSTSTWGFVWFLVLPLHGYKLSPSKQNFRF